MSFIAAEHYHSPYIVARSRARSIALMFVLGEDGLRHRTGHGVRAELRCPASSGCALGAAFDALPGADPKNHAP